MESRDRGRWRHRCASPGQRATVASMACSSTPSPASASPLTTSSAKWRAVPAVEEVADRFRRGVGLGRDHCAGPVPGQHPVDTGDPHLPEIAQASLRVGRFGLIVASTAPGNTCANSGTSQADKQITILLSVAADRDLDELSQLKRAGLPPTLHERSQSRSMSALISPAFSVAHRGMSRTASARLVRWVISRSIGTAPSRIATITA